MVFDEVDAGVGGRAARRGRAAAGPARARTGRRRSSSVTHLAQVAAFADRHVVVDKRSARSGAGVTASDVRVVAGDERRAELARMLAGTDSRTAREHAAELLADAAARRPRARTADDRANAVRKPVKSRR